MRNIHSTPFSDKKFELGEGLLWDSENQHILVTDILKGTLLELDTKGNEISSHIFPDTIGWALPTEKKDIYIVGLGSGLFLFNKKTPDAAKPIENSFPADISIRLNDACTDSKGRIWYGSMHRKNPENKQGKLASYSFFEGLKIHDEKFCIVNGPLISPNEKHIYATDSLERVIYKYDLCIEGGTISNKRIFKKFTAQEGCPDGMCFDIDSNIWIAMWGGSKVIQLNNHGDLVTQVDIPAKNVTNVCFFGPSRSRLLVSTSSLDEDLEKNNEFSGRLFEILNHQTKGVSTNSVRIK